MVSRDDPIELEEIGGPDMASSLIFMLLVVTLPALVLWLKVISLP